MPYHYLFRIIILGAPTVGKTSLTSALSNVPLSPIYQPTIGIDFGATITHLLCGKIIKCHLWDTAGQECFSSIVRSYYRDIAGAILVFDVTNRLTFSKIKYWLRELREENDNPGKLILIGNKIDHRYREVSKSEAEAFAKKNNMAYEEVSIKENTNVHGFFYDYIHSIYDTIDTNSNVLPLGIKKQAISQEPEDNIYVQSSSSIDCCILL